MKKIIIIGGGPAALMAADVLSPYCEVSVYEKEKTIGRKFLVAGKGGFNLTNSLEGEELTEKYIPKSFLKKALLNFGSQALRKWLLDLKIPTYVGSSGRVFPEKGIKPIEVLQKIKEKLVSQGVQFYLNHEFTGFNDDQQPVVKYQEKETTLEAEYFIFALGGASWPKTGSSGNWAKVFESIGILTLPFQASNCGININWPEHIKQNHAGKPLKNIRISFNGHSIIGEASITEYGLEGNAVYPLTLKIRESLNTPNLTVVSIDFKPFNTKEQLINKVGNKSINTSTYAKIFKLNTTQLALVKAFTDKKTFLSPTLFVQNIKALKIPVESLRPVEEAISTVGGINLDEVNVDFSLKKYPNFIVIGEMLDWDAPTGGFLLQACFSMGKLAGEMILQKKV